MTNIARRAHCLEDQITKRATLNNAVKTQESGENNSIALSLGHSRSAAGIVIRTEDNCLEKV